jgi:hypothetical protein
MGSIRNLSHSSAGPKTSAYNFSTFARVSARNGNPAMARARSMSLGKSRRYWLAAWNHPRRA